MVLNRIRLTIWSAIATLFLAGGVTLATAGAASAAPPSGAAPAQVQDDYLPGKGYCTPARDGERVWVGNNQYECTFVFGDWPPWQWEYISV